MIDESALIITPQGRIFHLDLKPDELADTILLVGDPCRVPAVSRHFDHIETRRANQEFISHTGHIGHKRISVVSTGIGTDNIDIVLNELDALANIDFDSREEKAHPKSLTIIRLGSSGSLQQDIPVDTLVASTFGLGLDNLLHYYRYEQNTEEMFLLDAFRRHTGLNDRGVNPYIAQGSIHLLNYFTKHCAHGITVSAPGFYAPQGRRLRLAGAFPGLNSLLQSFACGTQRILSFEMETSGIYGLGTLLGHRCLSVSAVIGNRITRSWSRDPEAAINHMILHSLEIIAGIK